jgi:PhnB protein
VRFSPRLIVPDPDAASAFYRDALGAEEVFRAPPIDDGRPGVVDHRIGNASFRVSPTVEAWGWLSPTDLGGSAVLLELEVDDPDGYGSRMTALGAEIVVAIEDRPYGQRSGRIRDPYGHLWILSGPLQAAS